MNDMCRTANRLRHSLHRHAAIIIDAYIGTLYEATLTRDHIADESNVVVDAYDWSSAVDNRDFDVLPTCDPGRVEWASSLVMCVELQESSSAGRSNAVDGTIAQMRARSAQELIDQLQLYQLMTAVVRALAGDDSSVSERVHTLTGRLKVHMRHCTLVYAQQNAQVSTRRGRNKCSRFLL